MPACDLPNSLWNILDVLLGQNGLKSWQIYGEKVGVTVKLRFGEVQNGGQTVVGKEDKICYSKKTPSQKRRDDKKADERQFTKSQTRMNDSVEEARQDNYNEENMDLFGSALSPCVPVIDSPTPVMDKSSPLSMASLDEHEESVVDMANLTGESDVQSQPADQRMFTNKNNIQENKPRRHLQDIKIYSNINIKCAGCANWCDMSYPGFSRFCNHDSHQTRILICNPCFHTKGFHKEHKDQIQIFNHAVGVNTRFHCDACGIVQDAENGLHICTKCGDYLLCDKCLQTNYHSGHIMYMQNLNKEDFG